MVGLGFAPQQNSPDLVSCALSLPSARRSCSPGFGTDFQDPRFHSRTSLAVKPFAAMPPLVATTAQSSESRFSLRAVLQKAHFRERYAQQSLNARQIAMLNSLLDAFEGKLTTSKWVKLTKCSQDTASRDILDLVERGVLRKDATGGRSTTYSLATENWCRGRVKTSPSARSSLNAKLEKTSVQAFDLMVEREGLEPSTPAL